MFRFIEFEKEIYKMRRACQIKSTCGELSASERQILSLNNVSSLGEVFSQNNLKNFLVRNHPQPKNIDFLASMLAQVIENASYMTISDEDLENNFLAKELYGILLDLLEIVNTYILHNESDN